MFAFRYEQVKCMVGIKAIGAIRKHTWMQRLKRGDISFFRLSRINPNIFSREAVSCCLNSIAGYRASMCDILCHCPSTSKGDLTACKYKHTITNSRNVGIFVIYQNPKIRHLIYWKELRSHVYGKHWSHLISWNLLVFRYVRTKYLAIIICFYNSWVTSKYLWLVRTNLLL